MIAALLASVVLTFIGMTATAPPANADDTDGGGGAGVAGGDGCSHRGWRLVDDVDQIAWFDSGAGDTSCGNTAYGQRNNNITFGAAGNPSQAWTDAAAPASDPNRDHRCGVNGGGPNLNCADIPASSASASNVWTRQNTSLYKTVADAGAGSCVRRSDVHGIWYLSDNDATPTFTNMGINPGGYRTTAALQGAIMNPANSVDSGTRGNNAWWATKARAWYDIYYPGLRDSYIRMGWTPAQIDQAIGDIARTYVSQMVPYTVSNGAPVIYCWYKTAASSNQLCKDIYPQSLFDNYLSPSGAQNSPVSNDCFRKCPTTQGDYPTTPPYAGQMIPKPTSSISPRPASTSQQDINNYCYPPQTYTWHQGGRGSSIPGIGYEFVGQHGQDDYANAQPYAYITSVEDGNPAYNNDDTNPRGNAPGQGQLVVPAVTKTTAFAAFWNQYCAQAPDANGNAQCGSGILDDTNRTPSQQFINAYNAAVAALPNETHAVTNLTNAEKSMVAKGRVMNVYERTKYASAQMIRYVDRFYTRTMSYAQYYGDSGQALPPTAVATGAWTYDPVAHPGWNAESVPPAYAGQYRPTFSDGTTFNDAHPDLARWVNNTTLYGTPKVSGLWQNAVAHCNSQGFGLLNPTGTASTNNPGVIDTGDTSQYYSASAVHKVSDSRWRVNEQVDLTQARWGALANNASAMPHFFDRLCYYPGQARNPSDNSVKGQAAPGDYTMFRDGEDYLVKGTNTNDSPYFVPDFKGEDRTSYYTVIDGYKANVSRKTSNDSWLLTWQYIYQNGTTPYDPGYTRYWGYTKETWTTAKGGRSPTTGVICGQNNPLSGYAYWSYYSGIHGEGYSDGGCKYIRNYRSMQLSDPGYNTEYVAPSGGQPTYAWANNSATYSDSASANNGAAYCNSQAAAGQWRYCNLAFTAATWTTPAQENVATCPMADTATVRYTNCITLSHQESLVTNYNVVQYNNEAPEKIIVTRQDTGTPKANWLTVYGQSATGTTPLFSKDETDKATPESAKKYQQQFVDSLAFKSSTVAIADGAYKQLRAEAVWASDRARPQVLTVAWLYKPNVRSTFATDNVGYGRAGGAMTYTASNWTSPVRGRVEAENRTLAGPNDGKVLGQHQDETYTNSGTAIPDRLNRPVHYGTRMDDQNQWTTTPWKYNPHYYMITFVRAVGE